jgi:hypothetical protein
MNPNNTAKTSRFEGLKRLISDLFGVNETLFLLGFISFFYGISQLWSLEGAFTVSGALLMSIAIVGVVFANRKVK